MGNPESMFELTDLWCDGVDIGEYMDFTEGVKKVIEEWQEENAAVAGFCLFSLLRIHSNHGPYETVRLRFAWLCALSLIDLTRSDALRAWRVFALNSVAFFFRA